MHVLELNIHYIFLGAGNFFFFIIIIYKCVSFPLEPVWDVLQPAAVCAGQAERAHGLPDAGHHGHPRHLHGRVQGNLRQKASGTFKRSCYRV